jgi:hypothetical protein
MEINNVPPDHLGLLSELRLVNEGCFEYAKELMILEIDFHNGRIDSFERKTRILTIKNESAPVTFSNDPASLEYVVRTCDHLLTVD